MIEEQLIRIQKMEEYIEYLETLEQTKAVKAQIAKAFSLLKEDRDYLKFLQNN